MSWQQNSTKKQMPAMAANQPGIDLNSWRLSQSFRKTLPAYERSITLAKFSLCLVSLASFISLICLTTWYAPISKPVWTIVAESYATNLMVPHNLPSVYSVTKLAEQIDNSRNITILNASDGQKHNGELVVERLDSLFTRLDQQKNGTGKAGFILLQVAAHGLVDENGPYLLKDWAADITEGLAPPKEKDKIRIMALLKQVVDFAAGKPAAVVLNCESADTFKELGIWGNQFSESIIEMENWIEKQPNLIVILSTGKSQMNCVDSKAGESLYGRIWRESLTEGSELDQTFSLFQLHNVVAAKVAKEAAERFGLIQQPVLLPRGKTGESRASRISLVSLKPGTNGSTTLISKQKVGNWKERLGINSVNAKQSNGDDLPQLNVHDSITKMWQNYEKQIRTKPHPVSFKPEAWAVYKSAVLRYEELTLNGASMPAAKIRKQIEKLKEKIEHSKPVKPLIFQPSLAFSEFYLANESRKVPQWFVTAFDNFWQKHDVDIAKSIEALSGQYENHKKPFEAELLSSVEVVKSETSNQVDSNIVKNTKNSVDDAKAGNVQKNEKESSNNAAKSSITQPVSKKPNGTDSIVVSDIQPDEGKKPENVQGEKAGKVNSMAVSKVESLNNSPASTTKGLIAPEMRYWLLQLVIGKIRAEGSKNISHALEWANRIIPANDLFPLELQVIALASKDMNRIGIDEYKAIGHDSIANFVDLVVNAERAFAGLSDNYDSQSTFFNHTFFWMKPWNDKAERAYLEAWDHIFSPDNELRNKGILLQQQAMLQFKSLLSKSALIQKTLETYYLALERLPELSFWIVRSHLIDYSNEFHGKSIEQFDRISMAWNCIRSISKILENEMDFTISLTEREKLILEMATKSDLLAKHLDEIENHYMLICRRLINWAQSHDADPMTTLLFRHALRIPPNNIELRNNLVKSYQSLLERNELKISARQSNEVSTELFEMANYFCQRIEELQYDLVEDQSILSRYNPAELKKLYSEVNSLNIHAIYPVRLLDSKVTVLGEKLLKSGNRMDARISWPLDRLRRVLPLSMIENTDDQFVSTVQSSLTAEHLRLYAKRLWDSHWGPIIDSEKPYYQTVSLALLEEANRTTQMTSPKTAYAQSISELLDSPRFPEFVLPHDVLLHGSPDLKLPIRIHALKDQQFPEGFASIVIRDANLFEIDDDLRSQMTLDLKSRNELNIHLRDKTWRESQKQLAHNPQVIQDNVKVGFMFRGNFEEKQFVAHVSHDPDWRHYMTTAPKGGSLALRCDPALLAKLGRSGGSVAFVLDCSGSMGVAPGAEWNAAAKYDQAVNALIQTISQLPDGTNISIWVFGEAVGELKSADPLSTIRQVMPMMRWDPTDLKLLGKVRQMISYPACEPWNKSPVIESMEKAKISLLNQDGPKAMIVITDGQDNVYGRDIDTKNSTLSKSKPLKTDISKKIRTMFAETGISVNVIGYKLASEEQDAVEQQFSVVRDLSVPGIFTTVNENNELFATLQKILRRRLVYRFESETEKLVRPETIDGTEIQPIGSAIQWANPSLAEDVYKIWLDAGHRVEANVFLQNGRRELFKLVSEGTGTGPSIQRDSWIMSDFPWRPRVISDGWMLSWIGSKFDGDHLEMLLAIDKEPTSQMAGSGNLLNSAEPLDMKLLVRPRDTKEGSFKGEVRRLWNYPSNVWKVTLYDWKKTSVKPSIECLIQPGRKFESVLTLNAGQDFRNASELVGRTFETPSANLTIERFENVLRWVPDDDFQSMVEKKCWLIRTKQKNQSLLRADMEFSDARPRMTEYRYFKESGICETVVWPAENMNKSEDLKMPTAIRFRSESQRQPSQDSSQILLDLVDPQLMPSEKDPWPVPVVLLPQVRHPNAARQLYDSLPPALAPEIKPGKGDLILDAKKPE